MPGADVIEAAIGITLLLIVSYVVIGSINAAAGTVSSAQNDLTQSQQDRLGTSITVDNWHYHDSFWDGSNTVRHIDFRVLNKGNGIVPDPAEMTVMVIHGSNLPVLLNEGSGSYGTSTWDFRDLERDSARNSEVINPNQWDPGEYLFGRFDVNFSPTYADNIQVVLANGAYAMNTAAIDYESGTG